MEDKISEKLSELDKIEATFFDLSKVMMKAGRGLFPVDYFAIGVINRSLSLISGFTLLLKSKNYIGAAHLARPHLDNFLRFYAVWLVDNPHDFAMKVMGGVMIKSIQDKDGKQLSDSYLVKVASIEYPWIKNVYKETSGFVHFSKKHILTSARVVNIDERTVEHAVSKFDKYVDDESRIEAVECMVAISQCIIELIEGWIWTKNNEDKI